MKISEYFEQDHDRLDDLFHTFKEWKRKDYLRAREAFVGFKFGLQRHIVWEEEILFPLFEGKTGITQGPTMVMRMEHRQIGQFLEALHVKVKAGNPDSDAEENALVQILSLHNMKEESILYPAIDSHADPSDVSAAFEKMHAMPSERYEQCCSPVSDIPVRS
jgi:regulator of cell morphogenesis and NO signaling